MQTTAQTNTHRPTWWNRQYDSAWDRVKDALHRDLEQTKADLGLGTGQDLNQHVGDTVRQAVGAQEIPPEHIPNMEAPKPLWDEDAARYGYGAGLSDAYRPHAAWGDDVESRMSREWTGMGAEQPWDRVRDSARRGFDYARSLRLTT